MIQNTLPTDTQSQTGGPVECLGMTFPDDEARRAYFLDRLREKLKDPEFRKIEGFPIGTDEDILALSDPPYYTACPNPFIADFIAHYGRPYDPDEPYHKEPFAADVSEGKNDPIYNAHSYHTKVPHKAIMRYILHYTKPGDIVFDGFCGTGMTGVAARMCGSPDPEFRLQIEQEWKEAGWEEAEWGIRQAILCDLSPTATFIAHNYTTPVYAAAFEREARRMLGEVEDKLGWMYKTHHMSGGAPQVDQAGQPLMGDINYTVWSEVFTCHNCSQEIVFLEHSLDRESGQVYLEFACPHCNVQVSKRRMARSFEMFHDALNGLTRRRVKRVPVLINYSFKGTKYEKRPTANDIELLQRVEQLPLADFFPAAELPFMHISHVKDKMSNFGITHYSHFFLPRQQQALAALWKAANECPDLRTRHTLIFLVEQAVLGLSLLNRYQPIQYGRIGGSQVNRYMSGVLYVPSQIAEVSPRYTFDGKLKRLIKVFESLQRTSKSAIVSLNSGSQAPVPTSSVDYIFTDPPFGENLQYSELNWSLSENSKVAQNLGTSELHQGQPVLRFLAPA
jgi:DNA-directed RNA polymerase subunit RPC12/RpoP